jgi:hypothetical protein
MNSFSKFLASVSALIAALSLLWIAYSAREFSSRGVIHVGMSCDGSLDITHEGKLDVTHDGTLTVDHP